MFKQIKPIPWRLSQWGSGTEIIYKCPSCATSFNFYGNNELFCHNCGTPINWAVPISVSEEFAQKYHNASYQEQQKMLKGINLDR